MNQLCRALVVALLAALGAFSVSAFSGAPMTAPTFQPGYTYDSHTYFDLTGSELLRLQSRGIPYDVVSPAEVFKILGRY